MRHSKLNLPAVLIFISSIPIPGLALEAKAQSGAAAQNASGSVTIKANVRQVLVPVVVTDKKGRYITGLKISDFHVYEDGAPQKIVAFSTAPDSLVLSAGNTTATRVENHQQTANATSGAPRQTYLICMDTLHSSFANFARVRAALQRFFKQEASADSQYALIALGRETIVVRDSTRNPEEILTAVQSERFLKAIQDSEARNTAVAMQEFRGVLGRYCSLCGCGTVVLKQELPGCPGARAKVQSSLLSFSQRTSGLNQTFLLSLKQLVAATASMPTTRTIILISDGFNRAPGNELYTIVRADAPGDRSFEFNPLNTEDLLQNAIKLAVRNDVRFYTLDSRGLYALASLEGGGFDASSPRASEADDRAEITLARENTDGLAELAHETGGLFFENNNDLLKGIQKAFADSRAHYILAYAPSNKELDGKYRKIRVEIDGAHLHVNAKPGYWATKN